jgi:flavin-dependent dehydrogenase
VNTRGQASHPFYFFEQLEHEAAQTWQVLRSEFDQMLLDNAREKGAAVHEEMLVRDFIQENGQVTGVRATNKAGETLEFHAPMTIDATGRDSLAITRYRWRNRDPYLNKIAVWTYYRGAQRDSGVDEGATTIAYVPEKGWFWYIPLAGDVLSVGVVAEKPYLYRKTSDPAAIFHQEVAQNEWLMDHLRPGTQFGPYRTTGEYSYRSQHCATDGLVLAGDAFAFLDPVFSSGVFIALRSGEMAAETVHAALAANDVSAERFDEYGRQLCYGIESMRRLVYAFYDHNFSFRVFVDAYPDMKGEVTDCLMGNLFRDFNPLFRRIAEFARVPPALSYGRPLLETPAQSPIALP